MMQHEFEALAGYEVSSEDYDKVIEPMYMAVSMSKQEFVKVIDKKRFALKTEKELIKEMKKIAKVIHENCEARSCCEEEKKVFDLMNEYEKRFGGQCTLHTRHSGDDYGCYGRGCTYINEMAVYDRNWNEIQLIKLVG